MSLEELLSPSAEDGVWLGGEGSIAGCVAVGGGPSSTLEEQRSERGPGQEWAGALNECWSLGSNRFGGGAGFRQERRGAVGGG